VISRAFVRLCEIPAARRLLWRGLYGFLARFRVEDWAFMNYGYQPVEPGAPRLALAPEDEPERYPIQLYHRVAGAAGPIAGRDVLEVGSGRGGGASYVRRYLGPRTIVGVDFSKAAVRLANERLGGDGLTYVEGDAEALPFDDGSFDVVLNVESSHCYPSRPRFFAEVARVLRPGGALALVDMFLDDELAAMPGQLSGAGLTIRSVDDITPGVVEGLRLDGPYREARIAGHAPKALAPVAKSFAGTEGSDVYQSLVNGRLKYVLFAATKPVGPAPAPAPAPAPDASDRPSEAP
jgi:SAM-dependent methyltransferase